MCWGVSGWVEVEVEVAVEVGIRSIRLHLTLGLMSLEIRHSPETFASLFCFCNGGSSTSSRLFNPASLQSESWMGQTLCISAVKHAT